MCLLYSMSLKSAGGRITKARNARILTLENAKKLDGCIVWNAHNSVLGEEALLIYIVPVGYAT